MALYVQIYMGGFSLVKAACIMNSIALDMLL
jgi:hypothetical protein